MRFRKKTVLYAAGVLACGNIALQALGFVYRVMLSRFAGAEGLGMYRLANSVYLVLHTGCLSGVTMACSRLSAACEATGEKGKTGAVLRLAFSVFFTLAFASAAGLLLCGDQIAAGILGNPHAAQAFPFMLLCLMLTGIEISSRRCSSDWNACSTPRSVKQESSWCALQQSACCCTRSAATAGQWPS